MDDDEGERLTGRRPLSARSGEHWREGEFVTHRKLSTPGIVALALITLGLIAALTLLLAPAATSMLTGIFGTAHSSAAPNAATVDAALTPASANWYTFTSWGGGFRVDVPGVIGSSHGYFIDDGNGQGIDLYYLGAPISSPLQQREARIWVSIRYATKITDDNICPQGGVAVMIGSGKERVSAWVRDEGRIVAANLVLNGVAIEITLDSRDDSQPALAVYGDIWRHILASFTPLAGATRLFTHPCG
jgi:hypothetical protein